MAKYLVKASAVWVDNPGGKMRHRCKVAGDVITLKVADAKAYLDLGAIELIKNAEPEPEPETNEQMEE